MVSFRKRKLIRLKHYDYSQPGAYFVTICTHERRCTFGNIVDGEVHLSAYGQTVKECWGEIPRHFTNIELDEFVIMPNHIHGILWITDAGARHASSPQSNDKIALSDRPRKRLLGNVMGSFKSAVTKWINGMQVLTEYPVWQRNYYEHVIRDENELFEARQYIQENPLKWELDPENIEGHAQPEKVST